MKLDLLCEVCYLHSTEGLGSASIVRTVMYVNDLANSLL